MSRVAGDTDADLPAGADAAALRAFLREQLADPANAWSAGTFGALAEFSRDPDESFALHEDDASLALSTARGALRLALHPALRAIAYETLGEHGGWQHGLALCQPRAQARMASRRAVTLLGADEAAVDAHDRLAMLVDLGFGCDTADLCIRSDDPVLLADLRAHAGRAPLDGGDALLARIAAASPSRVFVTRLARIEVRQPIPAPDGVTPEGPHTHLLPQLMREGRTHAATLPLPDGWVPCATLHPPSALHGPPDGTRGFDADRHARFGMLLDRWGAPALVAIKRRTEQALEAGGPSPWSPASLGRHERTAARVAIRQWHARSTCEGSAAPLPTWAAELA